jgi:hypothetical protein
MKIVFNEYEHELELYNTNFVNVWHDWMFNDANEVYLIADENRLQSKHNEWIELTNKLTRILEKVNEISVAEKLPDRWHYDMSTKFDSNFLQKTHEKWAQITKESWEEHLPVFNYKTKEIYDTINKQLRKFSMSYNDINNAVHQIEFLYKFFMLHHISIQKSTENIKNYSIKHDDTSFVNDIITMPFQDIGRPQYEKYCISGEVIHPEISNFIHITNKLEFQSNATVQSVHPSYIEKCNQLGVPVWGTNVSIAKNKNPNPQSLGFLLIRNFSETKNNTLLLRK